MHPPDALPFGLWTCKGLTVLQVYLTKPPVTIQLGLILSSQGSTKCNDKFDYSGLVKGKESCKAHLDIISCLSRLPKTTKVTTPVKTCQKSSKLSAVVCNSIICMPGVCTSVTTYKTETVVSDSKVCVCVCACVCARVLLPRFRC